MKFGLIYIFLLLLLVGCSDSEREPGLETSEEILGSISVSKVSRATTINDEEEMAPGDVKALEGNFEFSDESLLYISQLGTTSDPNFTDNATSNLYIFQYKKNEDANWDENYNFVAKKDSQLLTWTNIKNMGSVGNAFSLYAMSFPGNEIIFNVSKDQSGGTDDPFNSINFNKSDILGAFHATSALYTRLRFNLFHLMTYLKVTLYVPDYQEKTNDGDQVSYSGYKEGAVQAGYVLNTYTDFTIDWRANRSSDSEAPLTYGTGRSTSIKMYMNEPQDEIIKLENVTDYFGASKLTDDNVRAYNFSVLFPARNSTDKTNISLCFNLQNIDQQMKYYYFESNQITTGNYTPAQGTLQQLYLYLPRTDNTAILVGAKILPWGTSSTDMTVTEEKTDGFDEEFTGSESTD